MQVLRRSAIKMFSILLIKVLLLSSFAYISVSMYTSNLHYIADSTSTQTTFPFLLELPLCCKTLCSTNITLKR